MPSHSILACLLIVLFIRSRGRGPATANDASKPCFDFRRNGTCKFGNRCRFSHGTRGGQGGQSAPSRGLQGNHQTGAHRHQQYREGKLREWKFLLGQGSQLSRPAPVAVGRFFQLGLDLMDGDVGAAQEAIKLLASECGLSFVKDVADRHILTANNDGPKVAFWSSELSPLFQLITHSRVVDSAVLEQEVAMIYNFLIGVGGDRMIRLLSFVANLVRAWPVSAANLSRMAIMELSLAVLSKMLDCNTTTMVNARLSILVNHLSESLNDTLEESDEFSRMQATKYLEYIRRRLEVGDDIAVLQTLPQTSVARESFVLRRDFPGTMSAEGPRHDNDHANISKIKILPTTEEIISPRGEYLPTNNPSQWHIQGIRGRLDREFRLLREDTVGQLRDAVRETLERIRNPSQGQSHHTRNSVRTYTYDFPMPMDVEFDRANGLQLVIRCNQPSAVQKLTAKQRREWWMQCKRLQAGGLVCILDATGSILFCVVSESTMRTKDDESARKTVPKGQESDGTATKPESLTLSENVDFLFLRLQLIDAGSYEVGQVLRWYRNVGSSPRRHLVEFPGILLPSFKHTLAALQRMYEQPNIPFSDLIAPPVNSHQGLVLRAPLYARKGGFMFELESLTHDKTGLVMNPQNPPTPDELASRSTLDLTQSSALLNSLSRELCLIQGPPGTGKSYTGEKIIKVLLAHKRQAKLGPILCVCYTNHALDQLLEHLLDDGIRDIIRIGSRSKSERLQDLNLRVVVRKFDRTKSEKSGIYEVDQIIGDIVRQINNLTMELSGLHSLQTLKRFLSETYPRQFKELFGKSEDGWQTVNHNPNQIVNRWLAGGSRSETQFRQVDELKAGHLSSMNQAERRLVHRHWIKSIRDPIITGIVRLHQEHTRAIERRDRVRGDVDLRCLQQADVVGITTTGLARQLDVLRKLRCKVMLCEEAGEVLEAHILTALLPSLEHVILIGDHLQLRPQIQNYDLQSTNPVGQQYSLDMSLFERLVQPPHAADARVPFSVLETQRRMHPSMAELIRSTLYPSLKDAETVLNYPKVVGVKERLFWLHHEQLEAAAANHDPLNTSHSNDFEIEMTAALVSHLIRQGEYIQGEIAVITPYLGQLYKLRRRMESMFEICLNDRDLDDLEALDADRTGSPQPAKTAIPSKSTLLKSVRVATVDNFQGEEAKVIVISLVRSNPQNKCGFLSTSNRINVLLSRAQHGMYIIGNSNTYQNVPMWADVINMLQTGGHFGTRLELQCPRHLDTPILVSQPDHFMQFSPESGCRLPCDKRLKCGHSCTGRCHSDLIHSVVKCLEDCPRPKTGCDHPCPLRCGDTCQEKCHVQLRDINLILPCGHHLASAKCWEFQDPASIRCMVAVSRTVPGCNHKVKVRCHEDVTAAKYQCTAVCGHHRDCGHTCNSDCFRCNTRDDTKVTRANHGICPQRCGRDYSTCRHSCSKTCHDGTDCPPCSEPCEVRCSHSRCSKPCNEPCAPCAEKKCQSCCPHSQCKMPCAAPCDWVPCSRRCEKMLSCGHRCPSLCGETCPGSAYCQQCATVETKDVCVDFIEMRAYNEINLDEEPCIFPDCGHFLTVSSMDGQMDMASHYELDEDGLPAKLHGPSKPFSMDDSGIAVCANCRGSLRSISRYGRIVRRAMLDEATKKFIAWSSAQYLTLAAALFAEQEKLENMPAAADVALAASSTGVLTLSGSRLNQLQTLQDLSGSGRYKSIIKHWKRVTSFKNKVAKEEQPFQRVSDFVKHANRQHKTTQEFQFDDSVIQVKGYLLATALLLKCDIVVFLDFIRLRKGGELTQSELKADLTTHFRDCENLISLAHSSVHPREEVQGHIFYAQLCGFSQYFGSCKPPQDPTAEAATDTKEESNMLKEKGISHVMQARALLGEYPSTSVLKDEIDAVENMLNDGEYRQVTTEEVRSIYMALAGELRGTGHWYTCQNGHPFTIGECGMPMEEARCPECSAPIGGRNHEAVEGVRRATEIEDIARGVEGLGV